MTVLIVLMVTLAVAGVGVVLWVWRQRTHGERSGRDDARLDAVWRSMQAVHRINAAFWMAHEAMRHESERRHF